jgi:hypothetical protein
LNMYKFDEPFIFISYAREDLEIVQKQIERIESNCYKVWYDIGDLVPGHEWNPYINAAIEHCSCFIVFATRTSVISANVEKEIQKALKCKKPIISIYWEKESFPLHIEEEIAPFQKLERYTFSVSDYEKRLIRAIPTDIKRTYLEKKEPPPPYSPGYSGISPKAICFTLILLSVFFFLFGLLAMAIPYFASLEPNDPLNNRLAAFLTGSFFILISAALGMWAFFVHRKYLRRKNDRSESP